VVGGVNRIPITDVQVAAQGLEHDQETPRKVGIPESGGAESGAVGAQSVPIPSDLREIIDAWSMLPETVRAGIVAMVKTAERK
jgi:hypothetical protein